MSAKNKPKSESLHIRITPDERKLLDEIAQREEISITNLIRKAIYECYIKK